jgi:Glyoxalase/Bleomycin resistance protein/Dioxygenase superfamily
MTQENLPFFEQRWPEGEYRLFQLGFMVDDLVTAATKWADVFRIGPFHVLPPFDVPCTYRGVDTRIDMQIAVAQAGPVQIELIHQRDDRPSVYREFAERHGSGVHQLCTVAADYDAKKAYYVARGYPLVCEIASSTPRTAFFDTFDEFGFYTEVAEPVPSFLTSLEAIARTCAEWDGTDPVRLLTRDGYRTP